MRTLVKIRERACLPWENISAVPSIFAQRLPICLSWAPSRPTAASTVRSVSIEAAASRRVTLKWVLTPQGSSPLAGDGITVSAVLSLCRAFGASAAVVCASSLLEIAFLREFAADFYSAGNICVFLDFDFEGRGSWMLISKMIYRWIIKRWTYQVPQPQQQILRWRMEG